MNSPRCNCGKFCHFYFLCCLLIYFQSDSNRNILEMVSVLPWSEMYYEWYIYTCQYNMLWSLLLFYTLYYKAVMDRSLLRTYHAYVVGERSIANLHCWSLSLSACLYFHFSCSSIVYLDLFSHIRLYGDWCRARKLVLNLLIEEQLCWMTTWSHPVVEEERTWFNMTIKGWQWSETDFLQWLRHQSGQLLMLVTSVTTEVTR